MVEIRKGRSEIMNSPYFKFCVGAMGCGKTNKLQGDYYNFMNENGNVIVIKPSVDSKGDNKIVARNGQVIETAFLIEDNDNLYIKLANYLLDHIVDFILVDEAQFLKAHHVEELSNVVDILGVNVICYGLRTDFRGYLFEGSKRLFEMADPIEIITKSCSCGNNKIYNMRLENGIPVLEGEQIAIDGVDATYESVCRKCYKRAHKKILTKSQKRVEE